MVHSDTSGSPFGSDLLADRVARLAVGASVGATFATFLGAGFEFLGAVFGETTLTSLWGDVGLEAIALSRDLARCVCVISSSYSSFINLIGKRREK